ncbi:MAG: class I SAM-dependent methyltransferase [Thermodesulfobacteriota bacterium]
MNDLEYYIKEQILGNGPLTFADFMNYALYHPVLGYYSSGNVKIGKKGDFYTSPHVSPAFGEIIGIFIEKVINYMEISNFTILELGAGKGYLALDILNYFSDKPELYKLINYIIVDNNSPDSYISELKIYENKINIFNNINKLDSFLEGIIISNELIDSLPFHRIIYQNKKFNEIYVNYEKNEFIEIIGELSTEDINHYLNKYDLNLADSKQFEVNLFAKEILKDINSLFERGYILTIDYGNLFEEYFNNKKLNGTFRCFFKHKINDNPYINIGYQDITCDVDFTNLIQSGIEIGLDNIKYTTQGQFLADWGILNIIERDIKKLDQNQINSIKNLFMPGMMGNYFKVLLQSKNILKAGDIYPESNLKLSFGVNVN